MYLHKYLILFSIFRKQEVQLTSNLFAVLGSKHNLSIHLDTLKWYTETKSMALIYVEEKLQNGKFNYICLILINNILSIV